MHAAAAVRKLSSSSSLLHFFICAREKVKYYCHVVDDDDDDDDEFIFSSFSSFPARAHIIIIIMRAFLEQCASVGRRKRFFDRDGRNDILPLAQVKPFVTNDEALLLGGDGNKSGGGLKNNAESRETKLLCELEMHRRSGDVRVRRSRREKGDEEEEEEEEECVFLPLALSSADDGTNDDERGGRRRNREKIVAYRAKIWTTKEKEDTELLFDNLSTTEKDRSDGIGKKLLLARVDANPNRTSDGFQLRGASLALAAEAERRSRRMGTTSEEKRHVSGDVLRIEMKAHAAFKHPSMNTKCDTFREIFKRVDANAKLLCEVRLVEAFEIIEIYELSTYEKNATDDDTKNGKVETVGIEVEDEGRSRCAVLKTVVATGESWETPSDFSEVSLRINDMNAKNNDHTFVLKRHESKKDSYERFMMALVRTMRKKETSVAFVPKERFLDFALPRGHHEIGKVIDAIRKNNKSSYDFEDYVAIEVHLVDWVSARDCFGDGKVIKTVLQKSDPSKSFPSDSPVQDTKVYIANLSASAETTSGTTRIVGSDENGNDEQQIGENFSFRLASGEMPRALETALRTACVGETIRVTVDVREEERTAFARKQRKERMHAYLDSHILKDSLSELVSRDVENDEAEGNGFRLAQVTFECTLTGFDEIVNWYSDAVAVCIKDGEDLKMDANALFKNGMLIEALEKYESVAQKLNQLASRALLEGEEEEEEKNETRIVSLRNTVLLNAAVTAKKLRDYTAAKKNLEKIPEDRRSFKAEMLKGRIFLDEGEFDLAKEAFRALLTEIADEEDEEAKEEKRKEIEKELARAKQLEKRELEEMRKKFQGKL